MIPQINNNVLDRVRGAVGFASITFRPKELDFIRKKIFEQWIRRIENLNPEAVSIFKEFGMDRYHENSDCIDHKIAWPKHFRILGENDLKQVLKLQTFQDMQSIFGDFQISDEEGLGYGNLYWRLVRPLAKSDIGPLHADKWFWDLGHGRMPNGDFERVKLWIAIFCESGHSGFRYVPGSHLKDFRYQSEFRDGINKPLIDAPETEIKTEIFVSKPGDAILFNDRLVHGGALGGSKTRVSIECTLLIPK